MSATTPTSPAPDRIRWFRWYGVALVAFAIGTVLTWNAGKARPTVLTVVLLVFSLAGTRFFFVMKPAAWAAALRKQARTRQTPADLGGRKTAGVAAGFAIAPALYGYALFVMSGELWRELIFLPLSLLIAFVGRRWSGRVMEELAKSAS